MIIIINGSIATGKTSVSWYLNSIINQSVMLDGDYLGAVNPFLLKDEKRLNYLFQTITELVVFHETNGYTHFVINYIFENERELQMLIILLRSRTKQEVKSYLLECNRDEQINRIQKRNNDQVEWEIARSLELNKILQESSQISFIGDQIDTSGKAISEISEHILRESGFAKL